MKKFIKLYRKYSDKLEFVEPILIITLSLVFTFILLMSIRNIMTVETVSIVSNEGESYFYEGKYDEAIDEYTILQKNDEWPKWKVKIAEIYSIKGEFEKSNDLLKQAVVSRNNIIEKNQKKYIEEDKKLISDVVFIYFMNKEYGEAISLGEYYLLNVNQYKPLMRTMFAAYIANGENNKAREIIESYDINEKSAYDIALLGQMQLMMGDFNTGYKTLAKAFNMDKDEIKVFDVIGEMTIYDKDKSLNILKELSEQNIEENAYKLFIAKIYSMNSDNVDIIEKTVREIYDDEKDSLNFAILMSEAYKNTSKLEEWNKKIEKIINSKKDSYSTYYVKALQNFENKKYEKAFEDCKRSILANKEYPYSYGILIPEIMIQIKKTEAIESYFRTALSKEPFNFRMLINVAEYYRYSSENYKKAIEQYKLALAIKPNDAEMMYNLGSLEHISENNSEAIKYVEKAILINSKNEKYFRTLSALCIDMGEDKKAIEAIRTAYALNEGDVLNLNNAACYYVLIEGDIWRAYWNIKAAYDDIPDNLESESKDIIIDNYKKINELINDNSGKTEIPELKLFY